MLMSRVLMWAARDAWAALSSICEDHSNQLCEALRLILEPTLASRLEGDFKTGKRINIRKVAGALTHYFPFTCMSQGGRINFESVLLGVPGTVCRRWTGVGAPHPLSEAAHVLIGAAVV
jgi:hypothetical protein